jgi:phosphoadenosine phosphosulfate reductase
VTKTLPGQGWIFTDDHMGDLVNAAMALLKEHEPDDGYYLAFSGGKDSACIHRLAEMAGVQFQAHYNVTTIDPPELVHHIKKHYPDTIWNRQPKHMLTRMVDRTNGPPTRLARWCCAEYKEQGGNGRTKVIGIRSAESPRRAAQWTEIVHNAAGKVVCPILRWSDHDVWEFHRVQGITPCSLYAEGWKRLGCIGCPMAGKNRVREFVRWPGYARMWRQAFDRFHAKYQYSKTKKGEDRWFIKKFGANWTSQQLWDWWMENEPELDENCQVELAFATPMDDE